MYLLPTNEAFAFDYISIIEVKMRNEKDKVKRVKLVDLLESHLSTAVANLGAELVRKVIGSEEYKNLYKSNDDIYKLIDKLENGENISAISIHSLNVERYKLKGKLQNKFFPSSGFTEYKNVKV